MVNSNTVGFLILNSDVASLQSPVDALPCCRDSSNVPTSSCVMQVVCASCSAVTKDTSVDADLEQKDEFPAMAISSIVSAGLGATRLASAGELITFVR